MSHTIYVRDLSLCVFFLGHIRLSMSLFSTFHAKAGFLTRTESLPFWLAGQLEQRISWSTSQVTGLKAGHQALPAFL